MLQFLLNFHKQTCNRFYYQYVPGITEEVRMPTETKSPPEKESNVESVQERKPSEESFVSIRGAILHSVVSWPQGRSEDTVLLNSFFDPTSPIAYSIYCIHGTGDRSFAFNTLSRQMLADQGDASNLLPKSIEKIYLLAFDGRYHGYSIEYFATQLKYKIKRNRDEHVILAGHSRGGDIAAYFTQFMAEEIGVTVHGVIPICAPLHGTPLAIAPLTFFSTSVAQMRTDSDFLIKLRESITRSESSRKKYYFFGVENDAVVPTENSIMKQNDSAIFLLPHHGHLSILQSPELAVYVSDCLHQIVGRQVENNLEKNPIESICLEIETELFALNNRNHFWGTEGKLKILTDLKDYLWEMRHGNRGPYFPEAQTIGEFIHMYLSTYDEQTGSLLIDILKQQLNPSIQSYFFSETPTTPAKSSTFIENLMKFYKTTPLPKSDDQTLQFDWELVS